MADENMKHLLLSFPYKRKNRKTMTIIPFWSFWSNPSHSQYTIENSPTARSLLVGVSSDWWPLRTESPSSQKHRSRTPKNNNISQTVAPANKSSVFRFFFKSFLFGHSFFVQYHTIPVVHIISLLSCRAISSTVVDWSTAGAGIAFWLDVFFCLLLF